MQARQIVYDDGVISVSLAEEVTPHGTSVFNLALKWLPPQPYRDKKGAEVLTTNVMGGETDWFVLPHTLAVGVVRVLIELNASTGNHFRSEGYAAMVTWFAEINDLASGMAY